MIRLKLNSILLLKRSDVINHTPVKMKNSILGMSYLLV